MKYNEEKINEWRLLLNEQSQKQVPVKNFCREKNITASQFYYYQKLIYKLNNSNEPSPKINSKKTNIKPIQIINASAKETSAIRFILPNNLQCVLPRDIEPHEVKTILELMMHASRQ